MIRSFLDNVRQIVKEKSSKFLYDIGSSQWQTDIDKTIMHSKSMEDSESAPTSLTRDEIRSYIDTVTNRAKRDKLRLD